MNNRFGNGANRVFLGSLLVLLALPTWAFDGGLVVELLHEEMRMEVGYPAVIKPGSAYPGLRVRSQLTAASTVTAKVVRLADGSAVEEIAAREVGAGETVTLTIAGTPSPGRYRMEVRGETGSRLALLEAYYFSVLDPEAQPSGSSVVAHLGPDGKMIYLPDYRGNRIPDFSMVGYRSGREKIPEVPVKAVVEPAEGDDGERIQAAIDKVAAMTLDGNGHRGAVLLKKGVYEIRKPLSIRTSGIVVRGQGPGGNRRNLMLDPAAVGSKEELAATLAQANGTMLITGGHAFHVAGSGSAKPEAEPVGTILDAYVPVGAIRFHLTNGNKLRVGDRVIVRRQANDAWVNAIGMDRIPKKSPWKARDYVLDYERVVTAVDGNEVSIDGPVVTAIEQRWGGGQVFRCEDKGRIQEVGIEDLRLMQYCQVDDAVGLGHMRGKGITIDNVENAWLRDVVAEHYYDRGAFILSRGARNVTLRSCSAMLGDDKYIEGYVPRYGYNLGGMTGLIEDCYAQSYRHAFYVEAGTRGPNAFHDCTSERDVTNSEPHHRWPSGILYDNVSGYVALMNRLDSGSGHGWSAANCVAWNTRGRLICEQPPTAQNWAIGHRGFKVEGPHHDWRPTTGGPYLGGGFGYWELHGNPEPIGARAPDHEDNRWGVSTLDDNPNSYWLVRRKGKWVEYDLRQQQQLAALKLSFPKPKKYRDKKKKDQTPAPPDRTYFFEIAVSANGKQWQTVYSNGKGEAAGHDVFQRFAFDEVTARYVRITANGSSIGKTGNENSSWFHLCRVLFEPEPQIKTQPLVEVKPASLYRQQLKDRYGR